MASAEYHRIMTENTQLIINNRKRYYETMLEVANWRAKQDSERIKRRAQVASWRNEQ